MKYNNKFFYARVSTDKQVLGRQLEEAAQWLFNKTLDEVENDKELKEIFDRQVYTEVKSGKNVDDRKVYKELLNVLRYGDTLAVSELSRLGRDYESIINNINYFKENGIGLVILDNDTLKLEPNASTQEKMMFDVLLSFLSYIADMERKKMLERQRAGIAFAKKNNPEKYKGRPLAYSKDSKGKNLLIYNTIVDGLKEGNPIMEIHRKTGVSRSTIYKIKQELEEEL